MYLFPIGLFKNLIGTISEILRCTFHISRCPPSEILRSQRSRQGVKAERCSTLKLLGRVLHTSEPLIDPAPRPSGSENAARSVFPSENIDNIMQRQSCGTSSAPRSACFLWPTPLQERRQRRDAFTHSRFKGEVIVECFSHTRLFSHLLYCRHCTEQHIVSWGCLWHGLQEYERHRL